MQITIDTSKDSKEDIRKAARFLNELANSNSPDIEATQSKNSSVNIFDSPVPMLGAMAMFSETQPETAPSGSSMHIQAEIPGDTTSSRTIHSGSDGMAQKILDSAGDYSKEPSPTDMPNKETPKADLAPGVIVY